MTESKSTLPSTALDSAIKKAQDQAAKRAATPVSGGDATPPVATEQAPTPVSTHRVVVAGTEKALPPDLLALGLTRDFTPMPVDRLTMVVLGLSGSGKTTLVSSIPRAVVATFHPGAAGHVIAPRAHHLSPGQHISTWAQWVRFRDALLSHPPTNGPFDYVVIDTLDEWFDIVCQGVVEWWNKTYRVSSASKVSDFDELGQKGWVLVADWMIGDLVKLQSAGFGWIGTGHLKEKEITVGDGRDKHTQTVVRPVLSSSCIGPIRRVACLSGTLRIESTRVQFRDVPNPVDPTKTIRTTVTLDAPVRSFFLDIMADETGREQKQRLRYMPPSIELPVVDSWKRVSAEYAAAVEKGRKEHDSIIAERRSSEQQ